METFGVAVFFSPWTFLRGPSAHKSPDFATRMPPLGKFIQKGLAQAIEESGKTREEVNLLELCDSAPFIFGKKKDLIRLQIRVLFKNWKGRSIRSWSNLLKELEVSPNEATRQLLREEEALPPSRRSKEPPVTDTPTEQLDLSSALSNLSVQSPPIREQPLRRVLFQTPPKTPPKTPPRYPKTTRMATPTPPPPLPLGGIDDIASAFLPGSELNPHIIHVTNNPEDHREFCITQVERMLHGHLRKKGYHIRILTDYMCIKKWCATMYRGSVADFHNRALLVKGPSRSCWFDNVELYHRADFCKETKDSHFETRMKIASNEARQFQYWLLVFPPDVILDQSPDGDPDLVERNEIGIMEDVNGIQYRNLFVFWKVYLRDGGVRTSEPEEVPVPNLFH